MAQIDTNNWNVYKEIPINKPFYQFLFMEMNF